MAIIILEDWLVQAEHRPIEVNLSLQALPNPHYVPNREAQPRFSYAKSALSRSPGDFFLPRPARHPSYSLILHAGPHGTRSSCSREAAHRLLKSMNCSAIEFGVAGRKEKVVTQGSSSFANIEWPTTPLTRSFVNTSNPGRQVVRDSDLVLVRAKYQSFRGSRRFCFHSLDHISVL